MKIGSTKFAPANFHRNKTKSERKETHSGGGAAPGGSLGRFSGVALCALCGSLCGACVSGSISMVKDIYELSKEIVTKLIAANDYMLSDEEQRSLRLRYQLEAVTACKNLLFLVEQAYEESYISSGSCVYWTQLISDVKNMTLAWHKKDKQR